MEGEAGEVEEEGDVLAAGLGLDALDLLGYRVRGADQDQVMLELEVEPVGVQVTFFHLLFDQGGLPGLVRIYRRPCSETVGPGSHGLDGFFVGLGEEGWAHDGDVLTGRNGAPKPLGGCLVVGGESLVDSTGGQGGAHGAVALLSRVTEGADGFGHDVDGRPGLLVGAGSDAEGDQLTVMGVVLGVPDQGVGFIPAGCWVGVEFALVGEGVVFQGPDYDFEGFPEEGRGCARGSGGRLS